MCCGQTEYPVGIDYVGFILGKFTISRLRSV